jgi:predicted  nucleic acid-binding Zn-ribbon protein
MKKCLNCGFEYENSQLFCPECGSMDYEILEEKKSDKRIEQSKKERLVLNEKNAELQEDSFQMEQKNPQLLLELLNDNEEVEKTWTLHLLPSYTIGRISSKGSVDIDLTEVPGGAYVSRQHGKFFRIGKKWYYTDLNSRHGTELVTSTRREKLIPEQEYALSNGDILILAKKVKLRVRTEISVGEVNGLGKFTQFYGHSQITVEDIYTLITFPSPAPLAIGLTISSREKFPLVVGCSMRNREGKIVDLPPRLIKRNGKALWIQDFIPEECKYYEGWEGEIIFALWSDNSFSNRLADTGWIHWFIPKYTKPNRLEDEKIKVKYGDALEVWLPLLDKLNS